MKLKPDGGTFSAVLLALIVFFVVLPIGGVVTCVVCTGVVAARGRDAEAAASHDRIRATLTACNTIRDAEIQWIAVRGTAACPGGLTDLHEANILAPGFSNRDPWGGLFYVKCTDDEIVCRSPGPDGVVGTGDDVVVPEAARHL